LCPSTWCTVRTSRFSVPHFGESTSASLFLTLSGPPVVSFQSRVHLLSSVFEQCAAREVCSTYTLLLNDLTTMGPWYHPQTINFTPGPFYVGLSAVCNPRCWKDPTCATILALFYRAPIASATPIWSPPRHNNNLRGQWPRVLGELRSFWRTFSSRNTRFTVSDQRLATITLCMYV